MKRRNFVVVLLTVALLAGACGKTDSKEKDVAAVHTLHTSNEDGKHGGQAEVTDHSHHLDNGNGHSSHQAEHHQSSEIRADFTFEDARVKDRDQSRTASMLTVKLFGPDGQPLEGLELNHEKKMHLIVVSKDLSYFSHVHPVDKGEGVFEQELELPAGGSYKLIADFVTAGGQAVKSEWITVAGYGAHPIKLTPEMSRKRDKEIDGRTVALATGELEAGKEALLSFHFTDTASGRPITDMQPYLGAAGHVVILSEDGEKYLHVHPLEEHSAGPVAEFKTVFPKSGLYKLWGQFRHKGELLTVPFVMNIP
ncbi:hypothetical protein [Paenibacillus pinihumi]|uniref:hypothetical protein n=1 Tax=Paenibacillus pinihumi TaxID=669462 RepID=UPI0004156E20|nr:hypothetical protein [Paenibacillus pinihumi]